MLGDTEAEGYPRTPRQMRMLGTACQDARRADSPIIDLRDRRSRGGQGHQIPHRIERAGRGLRTAPGWGDRVGLSYVRMRTVGSWAGPSLSPPHRVDNVAWIIYPFERGVPVSEWVFKHCFPDRRATTQQRSCMLCFAVSKTGFWAVRCTCERLKVRVDLTADGCRYTVLLTVLQRLESIKKMLDGAIDAPWEESPHIDRAVSYRGSNTAG